MFNFMAAVEKKTQKRAHMEQLTARALESEQESEESAPEEVLVADTLVSKHMGKVHRRDFLMHCN